MSEKKKMELELGEKMHGNANNKTDGDTSKKEGDDVEKMMILQHPQTEPRGGIVTLPFILGLLHSLNLPLISIILLFVIIHFGNEKCMYA